MRKFKLIPNTWFLICTVIFLAVLPLIATVLDETFYIGFFSRILIYGMAAVSLDLIIGYGGMVSLGHAVYLGVGAYVVGILAYHGVEGSAVIPWLSIMGSENALVSWPIAIIVSALLALAIGAVSLRTTGVYFIMITLAFAQMVFFFFTSLEKYGGEDGLSMFSKNRIGSLEVNSDVSFYYLCFGLFLGFLLLCYRLVNSRFGMVIQGSKENNMRMQALGFETYRYRLTCFVIAGAGAGLAGALMANQTEFVSPSLLHWGVSGEIMVMVILGGVGTLIGPAFGAAALLIMEEILAHYTEHWMLFLGPILIFVILFARKGLYGSFLERRAKK